MSTRIQDINPNPVRMNKQANKTIGSTNSNARKILDESENEQREYISHLSRPVDKTFLTPVKDMLKKLNIF